VFFGVSDVYVRYNLDVREQEEGGAGVKGLFSKPTSLTRGKGGTKSQFLVGRL